MLSIIIHFHRNVLSAQCQIVFEPDQEECKDILRGMKFLCESNGLRFSFFFDNCEQKDITLACPKNFFIPSTFFISNENGGVVSDININSEFSSFHAAVDSISKLLFRLQISNANSLNATHTKTLSQNVKNCPLGNASNSRCGIQKYFLSSIKPNVTYSMICTNCNEPLTKGSISFSRTIDYSENHAELCEMYFCHKKDVAPKTFERNALHLSNVCFYLNSEDAENFSVQHKDDRFECAGCSSILTPSKGAVQRPLIPFFLDKIAFVGSAENEDFLKDLTFSFLLGIIQSKTWDVSTSSKVLFQSKVCNDDVCLLLWIFQETISEYFQQLNLNKLPNKLEMKTEMEHKALFYITDPQSEIVSAWKQNFDVEFYEISDSMMSALCKGLQKSAKYSPGFSVNEFFTTCLSPRFFKKEVL